MRNPTSSDLPILRSLRDAYRKILDAANDLKKEENDAGQLLAICTIIDEVQDKFERVGKQLSRLERIPC
jgi:hypothetical protein